MISKTINGLFNGVSQQAPSVRLESQLDIQKNLLPTITKGLEKRPSTQFIKQLETDIGSTLTSEDIYVHAFSLGTADTDKYIAIFTADSSDPVFVYDIEGKKHTPTYSGGASDKNYCVNQPSSTANEIRCATAGDTTMIINRSYTPAMSATPSPKFNNGKEWAYIWVKNVVGGGVVKAWTINLNGTEYSSSPVSNYSGALAEDIRSSLVADTAFNAAGSIEIVNSTATNRSSLIRVKKDNDGDFTISFASDSANLDLQIIKKNSGSTAPKVSKMSDLPPYADDGVVIKIIGEDGDENNGSFYVKYSEADNKWLETVAEDIEYQIDGANAPRKMIRGGSVGSYTFTISEPTWDDRTVGDTDTAPDPSWIGSPINDVFFYKNRLGFLSGENVVLSRVSDFFNFFPTTVVEVLDDDAIDFAQPLNETAILRSAIPFTDTIMLFSDEHQFAGHSGSEVLSPNNFVIDHTTSFEVSDKAKPVQAGANLYFVHEGTNYSNIREYFVEPDTLVNDASSITNHIPEYLPVNIKQIFSSSNFEILCVISHEVNHRDRIYIYKYFWDGDKKAQSSWGYWDLGSNIEVVGGTFFGDVLYMILRTLNSDDTEDLVLEKLVLTEGMTGTLSYLVHADRQFDANVISVTASLAQRMRPWVFSQTVNKLYKLSEDFGDVEEDLGNPVVTPNGMCWDGDNLRIIDAGTNLIHTVDYSGTSLSSFATLGTSGGSAGICWDGNFIWQLNASNDTVYKTNATTGASISSFSAPSANCRGLTWDGTNLWTTDFSTGDIYEFDTSGTVVNTFTGVVDGSSVIDLSWDGAFIWLAYSSTENKVRKFTKSMELIESFDVTGMDTHYGFTFVGDSTNLRTKIVLPFKDDITNQWHVIHKTTGVIKHAVRNTMFDQDDSIYVEGDIVSSITDYMLGRCFESQARLSEWYVRDNNGAGYPNDKVKIRNVSVHFIDSGDFKVTVTPEGRTGTTHKFSNIVLGQPTMDDPSTMVRSGDARILVQSKAKGTTIDIKSDSVLPLQIESVTFEGQDYVRTRRI